MCDSGLCTVENDTSYLTVPTESCCFSLQQQHINNVTTVFHRVLSIISRAIIHQLTYSLTPMGN